MCGGDQVILENDTACKVNFLFKIVRMCTDGTKKLQYIDNCYVVATLVFSLTTLVLGGKTGLQESKEVVLFGAMQVS